VILALRKTHADGASWLARVASWATKARLVSQYCHAGMVVDGELSHATPAHGLHAVAAGDWQPDKWVMIDCGNALDHRVRWALPRIVGAPYDWFSLLAFVGLRTRSRRCLYCFEWCWYCLTGELPTLRITPEMLIEKAYELKLKDMP
jgi:uncharacterized protein YycO